MRSWTWCWSPKHESTEAKILREGEPVEPSARNGLGRLDFLRKGSRGVEDFVEVGIGGIEITTHERRVVHKPCGAALRSDPDDFRIFPEDADEQRPTDLSAHLIR